PGIDVEREPRHDVPDRVEKDPVVAIEEQDPAEQNREAGKEERKPEAHLEPGSAREIRSREEPRDADAEPDRDGLAGDGEADGVAQRGDDPGLAEGRLPVVDSPGASLPERTDTKAIDSQEQDRIEHDERDERQKRRVGDG